MLTLRHYFSDHLVRPVHEALAAAAANFVFENRLKVNFDLFVFDGGWFIIVGNKWKNKSGRVAMFYSLWCSTTRTLEVSKSARNTSCTGARKIPFNQDLHYTRISILLVHLFWCVVVFIGNGRCERTGPCTGLLGQAISWPRWWTKRATSSPRWSNTKFKRSQSHRLTKVMNKKSYKLTKVINKKSPKGLQDNKQKIKAKGKTRCWIHMCKKSKQQI